MAAHYVATGGGGFVDPRSLSGLKVWCSAQAETGYADGAAMTQWTDRSGLGNHLAIGGTTPTWSATNGPAGGAAVMLEEGFFTLPSGLMASATAGEVAVKMRARVGDQGMWDLGSSSDLAHFPYAGTIYDDFGSATRRSTGSISLNTWYAYQAASQAGNWSAWLDGVNTISAGTNTVGWPATLMVGQSAAASWPMRGRITTFVLYDRVLTTTERAELKAWMDANPSGGTV